MSGLSISSGTASQQKVPKVEDAPRALLRSLDVTAGQVVYRAIDGRQWPFRRHDALLRGIVHECHRD